MSDLWWVNCIRKRALARLWIHLKHRLHRMTARTVRLGNFLVALFSRTYVLNIHARQPWRWHAIKKIENIPEYDLFAMFMYMYNINIICIHLVLNPFHTILIKGQNNFVWILPMLSCLQRCCQISHQTRATASAFSILLRLRLVIA